LIRLKRDKFLNCYDLSQFYSGLNTFQTEKRERKIYKRKMVRIYKNREREEKKQSLRERNKEKKQG
jgi:hypothetical protein